MPSDMLTARIFAPARFAASMKSMPRIISEVSACAPKKLYENTFTGSILTFQFNPDTPVPLFPAAPMMPATCVPCPVTSPIRLIVSRTPLSISLISPSIVDAGPIETA